MLTIYRRHRRSCIHREKGRRHRHCQCPIWVDGYLSGEEIRESLKVRDWRRAQELIREWEIKDHRSQHVETRVTIADAQKKYIADAEARKLNQATIYKYRLLFRHLTTFAEGYKLQFMDELDLDSLATFRASWTEGPCTSLKKLERLRSLCVLRRKEIGSSVIPRWI